MPWVRIALAALVSGVVASMTDWLFMGDWLYKPCGVFVLVCSGLHLYSYNGTLRLAVAVWFIGPLPLTIANALWLKLAPAIATSYALGWLVKLALAALAVALILG